MICMFYGSDQTSCIAYLSTDALASLIAMLIAFWGTYAVIKILLRLLGF